GLGFGLRYLPAPATGTFQDRLLNGVVQKRPALSLAMLVGGAILGFLGLWLRTRHANTPDDPALAFPLWFTPLLFGLIGIGVGIYLRLNQQLTLAQARLVVLITGGSLGLALALMAAIQAWIWRGVFFGGLPAWRGPLAWQLWLCVYVELLGLALM